MVIAGARWPRCTTQVDLPVQLGWHYQQRIWNRRISNKECRISNKECRTLKGDTRLLSQKGAKRHESQWKPEHAVSRRQRRTFLTSQPVFFSIRNSLLDILLLLQRASIAIQGRIGLVSYNQGRWPLESGGSCTPRPGGTHESIHASRCTDLGQGDAYVAPA